jgi:hypothetical protein
MKHIAAIPTVYKGVQMRSRLEARWAAFFDLCGWQWEYEPFDLNGWIPDFMLRGAKTNTLVEVKPLDWIVPLTDGGYPDINNYVKSFPDLAKVFDKSDHEVLICGACLPPIGLACCNENLFAALLEKRLDPDLPPDCRCVVDFANLSAFNNAPDFHADSMTYIHRISGEYEGGYPGQLPDGSASLLWRRAGNATQWKAPRRK